MNSTSTTSLTTFPKPDSKKQISVFIGGLGAIGSTLLKQIKELNHPQLQFQIIGVCNSTLTLWNPDSEALIENPKLNKGLTTDWNQITDKLIAGKSENIIFIDATGNEKPARLYKKLLENGIHIITPSKLANTFEQEYFDNLISINASRKAFYRYETTVGAGLPVIQTIQNLINSGDEITEISGVVSGTMTYLFNQIQNRIPFSEAVRKAKELGYSEPDPRDDLSGEDVARKFLILARTSGFKLERADIKVESLFPDELAPVSVEGFFSKLPEFDDYWNRLNSKALVNNKKLRYVGKFTPAGIEVGIQEVRSDSPLGGLSGTDNLIQIYSKRYSDSPIVIQGPGAGKEVTAAGVLSDVVEVAKNVL